jgi:Xaa-Pro aminopeptidase
MPPSPRLQKVYAWLAASRLDGFLVSNLLNVRYLCGFSGSAGALLVRLGGSMLFTDNRYRLQVKDEVAGARVRIVQGSPLAAAAKWGAQQRAKRMAFERNWVTVAQRRGLSGAAGRQVRWRGVEGRVESLRACKDPQELDAMREAAALGSAVFEQVLPLVKPGVREVELAAEIEYQMKKGGASGPAFETIVAFGGRSALPHARPTERVLGKNELVVLDWGAILRGYCCDLTRTVFVGRAPRKIRRWYQAVLDAQEAAREALRPGVSAAQVDEAARSVLRRRGLSRYFLHSTGHGLGLEVHESPRLGRGQQDKVQAGNVVTLEPGVYVERVGGIRIEDDVAVTPDGVEVLTTARRDLIQL